MKKVTVLILISLSGFLRPQGIVDENLLNKLYNQLLKKEKSIGFNLPEYTEQGKWKFRNKVNWLSGFLSGELWYMYDLSGNNEFKKSAAALADNLLQYSSIDYTHDMGFIFLPGVYKAYLHTGDKKYLTAISNAAAMLAKRFNENGNFIRAWGSLKDTTQAGWIIIDTMMNLELLFLAAQHTGNWEYYDIAYKHALTTLHEIVRENYSSYHVVEFNPADGSVIAKRTHQGYSDESTWARGQAWGIYGFANAYKYTGDEKFLNASQKMADYFLQNLPGDFVPAWDLDLKDKNVLKDASAAAITASGLFLLADLSKTKSDYEKYSAAAVNISESLIKDYLFTSSSRQSEEGILLHTIYHYHKKWGVDESFPAGDYYMMETLAKYQRHMNENFIIRDLDNRQKYLLNKNWFYLEDNVKDISHVFTSNIKWKKIDLPHTWNKFDAVDNVPGYRRDASWYQKNIFIPEIKSDKKLLLHFEGANILSEVYVNGIKAGGHVGGYIGFDVDITPFIKQQQQNIILVRVDNSINREIIPSQKSDFFIYGGINRDVWLKVLPSSHISGLKISTPDVNTNSASTNLKINFHSNEERNYTFVVHLLDHSGTKLISDSVKKIFSSGDHSVEIDLPELQNPRLWSPENPYLYSINVEIKSDSRILDEVTEKTGYRWFEFRDDASFYLNGKKLLLRGTHWHEDYAGLGNALPDSLKEKDFKTIKEVGANFIRLAHYPQDPKVYELCDELGILVWDELPWCRGGVGDEQWKTNTKRMLDEMIDQNFNHPSIIIWSLGNEIYWLPDFPGGDNNDSLRTFLKELNDLAHQKDPGRFTALRKYYEGSDIVDVFSPSIWAGWYSGVYKNYRNAVEDAQQKYPKFLHMEYGGSSHVGRHDEEPIDGDGILNPNEWEERVNQIKVKNIASMGDWSENYIVDLFDWHLQFSENAQNFTGNAQWAFKDFGTPLRPENPIPYMNQKGLVDRAGNPKDAFYVFKSYWNDKDKFCYIESHSWNVRSGPKNQQREVNVFSNCEEVELFINGESAGRKKKDKLKFPASGLSWNILFTEGKNSLKAIGYNNNSASATDSMIVDYSYTKAGTPHRIQITSERLPNGNYLITALVLDESGLQCIDYSKRLYFSLSGSGCFIENMGTPTGSSIIEAADGKAQIEFKRYGFDDVTIEVRNQDFKGDYLLIKD